MTDDKTKTYSMTLDSALSAANARIAELESRHGWCMVVRERDAANARADAAERKLVELKEAWAESDAGNMMDRLERAESESAALRAELEDVYARNGEHAIEEARLRTGLTAANALLVEVPLSALSYALAMRISHHLAAQPAAAPQGWDVDDLVGKPATAPLDADQVAKACCDIAWNNGWVLTYKLERAQQPATAPTHDCDSPDCGTCAGAYFARTAPHD
jgi:hypothetical protein